MIKKRNVIFFLLVIAMGMIACTHKANDLDTFPTMSFQGGVLPILQNNCTMSGCHTNTGKAPGDYRFNTYDNVMKSVTAYHPESSDLYSVITGGWLTLMPPKPHSILTQEQRTTIWLWIMQGAKNTPADTTKLN